MKKKVTKVTIPKITIRVNKGESYSNGFIRRSSIIEINDKTNIKWTR